VLVLSLFSAWMSRSTSSTARGRIQKVKLICTAIAIQKTSFLMFWCGKGRRRHDQSNHPLRSFIQVIIQSTPISSSSRMSTHQCGRSKGLLLIIGTLWKWIYCCTSHLNWTPLRRTPLPN
jgi:hypothetical protein